jgi:hypothetical protein
LPKYAVRHPDRLQRTSLSFENFGKWEGVFIDCSLCALLSLGGLFCLLLQLAMSNTRTNLTTLPLRGKYYREAQAGLSPVNLQTAGRRLRAAMDGEQRVCRGKTCLRLQITLFLKQKKGAQ